MISLESLRKQAIQKCRDRIERGEKRIQPVIMPRMKERYGI